MLTDCILTFYEYKYDRLNLSFMKRIIILLFAFLFSSYLFSQCISNSPYGSYATVNSGFIENITSLVTPGDYITVTNILENDYIFTATYSGDVNAYIVLTDSDDNILAVTPEDSSLSYTILPGDITGGTIRLHLFLDAFCDTEDFNLDVTLLNATVAPTTCQLPKNPRISYRSDTQIDFNWEAPSLGGAPVSYDWEAVPSGNAQGVGVVDSGNTTLTNASATGLNSNTLYSFYIRSDCDVNGNSDWFETPPLRTNSGPPPPNDFCTGATTVVQDTNVDFDAATVINGTLLNTAGTDILAEQCSGNSFDNARDDVWYSFIAQTTDVTISLDPLFNGILTLLSDCDETSILACSDNNGSGAPLTEEINFNSLNVNQLYYVRIYYQGFATVSSNFTLKIWSSATLGTQIVEDMNQLQFYPNPVNDILKVESSSYIKHISVISISGAIVYVESVETYDINIDMSTFNTGIYFFKVITDVGTKTMKIIKK